MNVMKSEQPSLTDTLLLCFPFAGCFHVAGLDRSNEGKATLHGIITILVPYGPTLSVAPSF